MTEISFYWSNVAVGDGVYSSYDDDEFSDIWRKLFCKDRTTQGVIRDYESELEVTNPSGTTIRVPSGAALVDGKFYENDANVDTVLVAPAVATRKDRVILRKSWAAQTVRIAILTGVEGGGVPALTQTEGVTWEIPLATIAITTGSAITITDERSFLVSPLSQSISANAWILIEEKTIAGTETSIDFNDIPQDYKQLIIVGVLRHSNASVNVDLGMTFNGDSGANYDNQNFRGANATTSAGAATGDNEIDLNVIPAASGIANHVGIIHIEIPFYSDTTFFKTSNASIGSIPNTTIADFDIGGESGLWQSSNAITDISLFSPSNPATAFASGKIALYGVV